MESYLPENEYKEFENRAYANPQTTVNETNSFIDNLRSAQANQNKEILTQTQNLGTKISSNLGGLTGGEGYFTSRYQTPQNTAVVNNLRAAAQASALNTALSNEEAMWKKRYNDAYRAYQKRSWDNSTSPTNGGSGTGDIDEEETTTEITSIETDPIAKSRYLSLFDKYIAAGYPADLAEKKAKEDFGKSIDVDAPVDPFPYERKKATVGGGESYVYILPNGESVLVDESKYELIENENGYALRDKETGAEFKVGV